MRKECAFHEAFLCVFANVQYAHCLLHLQVQLLPNTLHHVLGHSRAVVASLANIPTSAHYILLRETPVWLRGVDVFQYIFAVPGRFVFQIIFGGFM